VPVADLREVKPSVDALLAGATSREPMKTADSLSSASFERVVIGGQPYVVKHLSTASDWIMRATGDVACRPLWVWRTGILDALPDCLDPLIVDVAHDSQTGVTTLLMPDVEGCLVPEGSVALPLEQHDRFVDHMGALHAAFWDWDGPAALTPMANRYTALVPLTGQVERDLGHTGGVPSVLESAWQRLAAVSPEMGELTAALATDPGVLVDALADTPTTLVHGDWKAGNLGSHPDGRTILLDWQWPGRAAGCVDLGWYLAVNCDRLPESKEATIAGYRDALVRHGVNVGEWFDRQLELALLGAFVQLGWSKTDDPVELGWWVERTLPTARALLQ
jgi:Phosphotransferase enzyme family